MSKNLNLAAILYDGAKVYVPAIGESRIQASNPNNQISNSIQQLDLININTATSDSLDTLPGIGPVTAGKIISGRPYTNISQLSDKKVVTSKVFTEIKDKITAY